MYVMGVVSLWGYVPTTKRRVSMKVKLTIKDYLIQKGVKTKSDQDKLIHAIKVVNAKPNDITIYDHPIYI